MLKNIIHYEINSGNDFSGFYDSDLRDFRLCTGAGSGDDKAANRALASSKSFFSSSWNWNMTKFSLHAYNTFNINMSK